MAFAVVSYQETFVRRAHELGLTGMSFESVAKKTLLKTLGESPSEALFVWLGTKTIKDPGLFAGNLSQILGVGATPLLSATLDQAEAGRSR